MVNMSLLHLLDTRADDSCLVLLTACNFPNRGRPVLGHGTRIYNFPWFMHNGILPVSAVFQIQFGV